jgi:hypothetical protein
MRIETTERIRLMVAFALFLTIAVIGSAFAQDTIGVTPVETAVIATLKIVAIAMIGWGFMRLMAGRHTVEALFCLAIGVTTRAVPRLTLSWTKHEHCVRLGCNDKYSARVPGLHESSSNARFPSRLHQAASRSFSLTVRSGRKMPSDWGSRIQS